MTFIDDSKQYYRHLNDAKIVTVSTAGSIDESPQQDQISWVDGSTTKGAATRRELSRGRGAFSGISLVGDERIWIIPDVLLVNLCNIIEPDYTISEDTIADLSENTVVWTVKAATQSHAGNQWLCLSVKQR